jgi:hypothetical protein
MNKHTFSSSHHLDLPSEQPIVFSDLNRIFTFSILGIAVFFGLAGALGTVDTLPMSKPSPTSLSALRN